MEKALFIWKSSELKQTKGTTKKEEEKKIQKKKVLFTPWKGLKNKSDIICTFSCASHFPSKSFSVSGLYQSAVAVPLSLHQILLVFSLFLFGLSSSNTPFRQWFYVINFGLFIFILCCIVSIIDFYFPVLCVCFKMWKSTRKM